MKNRELGHSQETSAAKADISTCSGRRIEKSERTKKTQRHWRTRPDPFEAVWKSQLEPLLLSEPDLTGTTLWEYLDEHFPGQYPEKLLRTLQRRVKHWRATQGPAKKVIFRQSVPAGQQGLSDFTHPRTAITIAGEPLLPFEQRVAQVMQRIYQSHNWLPAQRKWLERLAKQLVHEVIIDRDFVNNRFAEQGGAKQLDKVLGQQLDSVLEELS